MVKEVARFENKKFEYILILDNMDLERLVVINYDTKQMDYISDSNNRIYDLFDLILKECGRMCTLEINVPKTLLDNEWIDYKDYAKEYFADGRIYLLEQVMKKGN